MKLRYTFPAKQDLAEILDYILARSPNGALQVQTRIKSILELLVQYPQSGTATDDPTIRKMAASPYPYLIFYEPTDDEIIIHAVRHSARKSTGTIG